MSTMSLPDLSGSRLLTVTDNDHRGIIMVVAIICCIYCPMVLGLRAVGSLKNLGINDFLGIAVTLTGIVEYIIVIVAVSYGLGRTFSEVDEEDADIIGKLVITSQVLFFLTLVLSKFSVAMLCRRLFAINMKKNLLVCDIAAGICAAWGLGAIIATTADCGPARQIGYKLPFCSHMSDRWVGVAVTDATTEVLIFSLAVFVVIPLQARVKRKLEVLASFLPRLFIIVFIGLNVQSIRGQVKSYPSGTSLTNATVYRQAQVLFAIITAALPALNRSLRLFHSSLGNSWMKTSYSLSQSAGKPTGRDGSNADRKRSSIALRSLEPDINRSRARSADGQRNAADEDVICLRPDPVDYQFTSSDHPDAASASAGAGTDAESSKSRDSVASHSRIIRMERHWHVRHEDVG